MKECWHRENPYYCSLSDEGIALLEPYAEIERCGWGGVTSEALSEDELIAKAKSCAGDYY